MLDVVDPAELFEDYVYVSGTSPVFVAHFREYADYIVENYNPNKQTLIFDIGSNDGTFLNNFKEKGFPVLGIDPAQKIASQATARGIETLVGFFDKTIALQIREKHGLASVISANNVFAHIDDLNEIIEGVKVLLAKTGIFVFEVSYLVDVFEKTLFDTIYHEHLAYHAVNPLIAFFSGHKMDLIDTTRVNSHGGSIRGIVQNSCAGRPVFSSMGKASISARKPILRPEALVLPSITATMPLCATPVVISVMPKLRSFSSTKAAVCGRSNCSSGIVCR